MATGGRSTWSSSSWRARFFWAQQDGFWRSGTDRLASSLLRRRFVSMMAVVSEDGCGG
jgi:hypothetical protein